MALSMGNHAQVERAGGELGVVPGAERIRKRVGGVHRQ